MTAVWDDRLISRASALTRTAQWPLVYNDERCECGECGLLLFNASGTLTLDDILPHILRHMVVQHGQSVKEPADV